MSVIHRIGFFAPHFPPNVSIVTHPLLFEPIQVACGLETERIQSIKEYSNTLKKAEIINGTIFFPLEVASKRQLGWKKYLYELAERFFFKLTATPAVDVYVSEYEWKVSQLENILIPINRQLETCETVPHRHIELPREEEEHRKDIRDALMPDVPGLSYLEKCDLYAENLKKEIEKQDEMLSIKLERSNCEYRIDRHTYCGRESTRKKSINQYLKIFKDALTYRNGPETFSSPSKEKRKIEPILEKDLFLLAKTLLGGLGSELVIKSYVEAFEQKVAHLEDMLIPLEKRAEVCHRRPNKHEVGREETDEQRKEFMRQFMDRSLPTKLSYVERCIRYGSKIEQWTDEIKATLVKCEKA